MIAITLEYFKLKSRPTSNFSSVKTIQLDTDKCIKEIRAVQKKKIDRSQETIKNIRKSNSKEKRTSYTITQALG